MAKMFLISVKRGWRQVSIIGLTDDKEYAENFCAIANNDTKLAAEAGKNHITLLDGAKYTCSEDLDDYFSYNEVKILGKAIRLTEQK